MVRTILTTLLSLIMLVLASCEMRLNPLDPDDVDELTTCAVSLDQARSNLLAQGFEIDRQTPEGFSTQLEHFDSVQSDRSNSIQDINIIYIVQSSGAEQVEFTVRLEQVNRSCPSCNEPGRPSRAGVLREPRYYRENVRVHRRIQSILCGDS